MSTIAARLEALRQAMSQANLDAWIIPTADPHLSEYLPAHWQIRQWLSGFTGSAGTLVVLANEATLWTDGRYWEQASKQLAKSGIRLEKLIPDQGRDYLNWLATILPAQSQVGIDGSLCSVNQAQQLQAHLALHQIALITELDIIAPIWIDRPSLPQSPIFEHALAFATVSRSKKLAELREAMRKQHADWQLLSSLDDIAWLFNLRGQDVDFNPVFLAHALISADQACLYVDRHKLSDALQKKLEAEKITLRDYERIDSDLANLPETSAICFDPAKVTIRLINSLSPKNHLISRMSPTTIAKACKTDAELEHVRQAMIEDGAALCRFFAWFEQALAENQKITELTIAEKLDAERAKAPHFVSLSFPTIAGFNTNAASPHYQATSESFSEILGEGLLLIDSGGQYLNGTTDITRVVPIGDASEAQKLDYTLVLKGMIALSQAVFPALLPSPMLDAIARAPIWAAQLDYNHGTGHGVGYFLNVHEGPQVISCRAAANANTRMHSGMITSIEPGIYRPQQWGIRIENLVAARPCQAKSLFGDFLQFETLTLCPIDTRLIKQDLLSEIERQWLNNYHSIVRQRLRKQLTGEALQWLIARTEALEDWVELSDRA